MRGALLTAVAAVAAGAADLHAGRGLAFGGPTLDGLTGALADALGGPHVAGAAAGNVEPGAGPVRRGLPSSTFARAGASGDRVGEHGRDAGAGIARFEVRRADRGVAAATVRQQLLRGAAGTYIGELLAHRDSALIRWPDRPDRPLAVYVASGAAFPDWRPQYVAEVASAFAAWERVGVPLRFVFVDDSTRADVRVAWIDRFAEPISGRTVWARDDRWWLVDAGVTLALHHNDGAPLDGEQVRAIAMHEVGHLLGLDHTADPDNIMAPRVRVRALSAADQATARLLYSVPAGRVQ